MEPDRRSFANRRLLIRLDERSRVADLWDRCWRHGASGRIELHRLINPTVEAERGPPLWWLWMLFYSALVVFPIAKAADMRSEAFPEWARQAILVAIAIGLGCAAVWAGRPAPKGRLRLALEGIGLIRRPRCGTAWWTVGPLLVSATVTAAAVVVLGRVGEVPWGEVARLVVLTAPGEELIYRGALLVVGYRLLQAGRAEATVAVGFGLWHTGNALGESNDIDLVRVGILVGTIAFTTVGGLLFGWLRHRTGSLLGPTLGHIATNLPAAGL